MIENTFEKRKHVLHYDTKDIPTQEQITDILSKGMPLSSSKQKAFAFKAFVLGPDLIRSNKLFTACEAKNIEMNRKVVEGEFSSDPNPGLFHLATAPYTLIWTPRLVNPNARYKKKYLEKYQYIHDWNIFYVIIEICRAPLVNKNFNESMYYSYVFGFMIFSMIIGSVLYNKFHKKINFWI